MILLLAASGLRAGEMFGLECRHFDGAALTIEQEVWGNRIQPPKTVNAYRQVDLHPDVAALLGQFIGDRKTGFIFRSRTGKPLTQTNILKRELHPLLEQLGFPKCGFHSFRRFRNTHLRQSHCPPGVLTFWMGHSDAGMSGHYDRSREDVEYRRDVVKSLGTGFEVPKVLTPKPKLNRSKASVKVVSGAVGRETETVSAG